MLVFQSYTLEMRQDQIAGNPFRDNSTKLLEKSNDGSD